MVPNLQQKVTVHFSLQTQLIVILQSSAAANHLVCISLCYGEKREITFTIYHIYNLHDNRYCRYLRRYNWKGTEIDWKIPTSLEFKTIK